MTAGRHLRPHVADPLIEGNRIVSGEQSASIVHASERASIGEGDDGSLWILVHDVQRRPRGRDPGIVVESADVSYEKNGLVRVLDRRVARAALEQLVATLTGQGGRISGSLTRRSRIPDGDYEGLQVESIDSHYRVRARGRFAKRRMHAMQSLGEDRWLVVAGEESQLRRELVRHLMPFHDRALWGATRHGEKLLMGLGITLAALSFVQPVLAPLAVVAAVTLGLFRVRRESVIGAVRRRFVQPHIDRTMGRAKEREASRRATRRPGRRSARRASASPLGSESTSRQARAGVRRDGPA